MEEKIIKWSSKKIIWTIVLCLVELAFLLWILSFMMTYPKEASIGLVALRLFVLFLNHHCLDGSCMNGYRFFYQIKSI